LLLQAVSDRKAPSSEGHGFPFYKVGALAEHESTNHEAKSFPGPSQDFPVRL
jgi:hypothetical protein